MENYTKRLEKIGKEPSAAVIKRINEYNELQELLANNQGRLEEADVDDQPELKPGCDDVNFADSRLFAAIVRRGTAKHES